jgi:predicted nucleic acid-binding protein
MAGSGAEPTHDAVLAWLQSVSDDELYVSAVTIGELQADIELTRENDPVKAAEIETWLDQIAASYNHLPMDAKTFRCWARLMHRRSDDLLEDAMIAATAKIHNLVVVTRNVRDFEVFGGRVLNPFLSPPTSSGAPL